MDTTYLSACAALAGSAVGGLHQTQVRAQQRASDKSWRQELYRDFINEASRLHGDSLVHDKADITDLVGMYAF
jgi:hypothetical protein